MKWNAVRSALFFAVLGASTASADLGDWMRLHKTVQDRLGHTLAEFTYIGATGPSSASLRILYEGPNATLLVLRMELDKAAGTSLLNLKSVSTGETLEFDLTPSGEEHAIALKFGGQTTSFLDSERMTASTRAAAAQVIESVSPGFEDALRDLTSTGTCCSIELNPFARALNDVLFNDLETTGLEDRSTETDLQVDFDPTSTPPGSFDARFGQAYYE